MPPAVLRRRPTGLGERAVGIGKTAWSVGNKAVKIGRRAYGAGKQLYGGMREHGSTNGLDPNVDRLVELPQNAEEQLEAARGRRLQKALEKLPPQFAEEIVELIQQAQQNEVSATHLHSALERFFRARFREHSELNDQRIKVWVERIMKVTHPELYN